MPASTLFLQAEASDFVRFNHAAVRQATHVTQGHATLAVVNRDGAPGRVDARAERPDVADDIDALQRERAQPAGDARRRARRPVPAAARRRRVERARRDRRSCPRRRQVIDAVARTPAGADFVGFYAGGPVVRAFADSRGPAQLAPRRKLSARVVPVPRAGQGGEDRLRRHAVGRCRIRRAASRRAAQRLALLAQPALTLSPGAYRAYLAPAAMAEMLGIARVGRLRTEATALGHVAADAAGARRCGARCARAPERSHRARRRAGVHRRRLHAARAVPLVSAGRAADTLNSPRSAREFGVPANGANAEEIARIAAPRARHAADTPTCWPRSTRACTSATSGT